MVFMISLESLCLLEQFLGSRDDNHHVGLCIGMMILIAMFTAVVNVGRGKLGRAFMIFPMLIYDFGTMLLLTGGDFRFFHFNFVIIIPLLYLILSGSKNHETVS